MTVDHELLRNLLLQAVVSVSDEDYQGIDRSDTYVRAGFGAKYLMNRYIHLDLDYNYLSLDSDAQGRVSRITRSSLVRCSGSSGRDALNALGFCYRSCQEPRSRTC